MARLDIDQAFVTAFYHSVKKLCSEPVVVRSQCRYCGGAQTQPVKTLAVRRQAFPLPSRTVAYAHKACVAREES